MILSIYCKSNRGRKVSVLASEDANAWFVAGVPTDFNKIVIVRFPFATLSWARLVRSHSIHPEAGERVRVERVISLVWQTTLEFQFTDDSENGPQA